MTEEYCARKLTQEEKLLDDISSILLEHDKKYTNIGLEIGALVDEKNAAYGDSFTKAAEFLKILYPNGIPVDAYTDALCIVRIFDKLMRLATSKDYNNERPYADIAGYAFLGLQKDRLRAEQKEKAARKINIEMKVDVDSDQLDNIIREFEEKAEMLPAEVSEEELARPIIKRAVLAKKIDLDRLR